MDKVNLPTENAVEPDQEAQQPGLTGVDKERCHNVTFVESSTSVSQNSIAHRNVLSQPPKDLTHKQKLLWLQQRRTEGLWAQCDDCDRWRYLPQVLDSHELPAKWYCWMNPDTSIATCLAPEVPICLYDEDDLIHAEYAAGSLVLARMPGFPWWPAMVCDCPDIEQYYWIDGFSDIPTHYNVVFFDSLDASRAWIAPEQLMPYKNNTKLLKKSLKIKKYRNRLNIAVTQANDAEKLPLSARLAKYSFISRFNGNILTPKKIKKQDKVRYQNILKRKLNIADFSDESLSSEEEPIDGDTNKINKSKKAQKKIKKSVRKSKYNTQNHESTKNMAVDLNSPGDLCSIDVQKDRQFGLIKSTLSEDTNTGKDQEIKIISDSFVSQNLQSQDATDTNTFTLEEDSEKSDNFEF